MPYQALYRKFRPQEFEDVKGQDHIVTTLRNQIKNDRIGHAYLFTGTRGTGKTTVAKIFARAVNCENPRDGSPCGECELCREITAGNSMNVIEIDAASNNGVSNIRDIIDQVAYPPTKGKYKVYIIDEVHMLSVGAFNALLKTLEEPPEYVIFILATTEVNKIPITILSRCQRYDFHRISIDTIAARLSDLMEQEGVEVEERAIRYVAKAADGSMRDALSLLDQCIAFYLGKKLTYDDVLEVLGAVDTEIFSRLLRAIKGKDVNSAIAVIEDIVVEGRELGQFVTDFTWYLRNLLLLQSGDHMEDVLDISTEHMELLKEEAKMIPGEVLMRYIRILSDLSGQLRYASQKRVLVEVAVIKLCRPQMEQDVESLVDRMNTLEEQLASGAFTAAAAVPAGAAAAGAGAMPSASAGPAKKKELPKAIPEEVEQVVKNWSGIVHASGSGMMENMLQKALVTVSEQGELLLVYDASDEDQKVSGSMLQRPEKTQQLKEILAQATGRDVGVRVVLNEGARAKEQVYTDAIDYFEKNTGMEVEEEDF